ncbi:pseudouridine synthase [Suillus cothurnatus]|nr:pseudouridine synthase [Suillus cothurnatus]
MTPGYESWSKDELIARLRKLDSSNPLTSPLPTVEDVLFKAFLKARLIDEIDGLDGCGRTDRGVSTTGQVVSLWIRTFYEHKLRYAYILNRVLPSTIRVLTWSPVSPNCSSRFNCKRRHYKYLDPGKQITNFHRCVMCGQINSVSPESDGDKQVYVFDLIGSAFLYHQVRHIMAALFLVGTGLERPPIISALMNVFPVESNSLLESQMEDTFLLVLWDSTDDDGTESGTGSDLYYQLCFIYQRSLIHATLDEHLTAATQYHSSPLNTSLLVRQD